VAIYTLAGNALKPLRPKTADVGLFEQEVEDPVWSFPEEIVGEPLFLVTRQPTLPDGSLPTSSPSTAVAGSWSSR
jgi:hypothetical protein